MASGSCCTINTGPSLVLPSDMLVLPCHGDPAAWISRVGPSCAPADHKSSRCFGGPFKAPDLGLGGRRVGQPASSPAQVSSLRQALQHCPASLPNSVADKGQGQLHCWCPCGVQSPTLQELQPVRGRAGFPALTTAGSAHAHATSRRERGHLSPPHYCR